jgi:hypothetical protein
MIGKSLSGFWVTERSKSVRPARRDSLWRVVGFIEFLGRIGLVEQLRPLAAQKRQSLRFRTNPGRIHLERLSALSVSPTPINYGSRFTRAAWPEALSE